MLGTDPLAYEELTDTGVLSEFVKSFKATIGSLAYGAEFAAGMLGSFQLSAKKNEPIAFLKPLAIHNIVANLEFKGVLTKVFSISKLLTAKIEFLPFLQILITKFLPLAQLNFSGFVKPSLIKKQILEATLSFSGFIAKNILHGLNASLSFVGFISRLIIYTLFGSLSFSGRIIFKIQRLIASLSLTGNAPRDINHQIPASLNYEGLIKRYIYYLLSAFVIFKGSSERITNKTFSGSLTFVGTLPKNIVHFLSGFINFLGQNPRNILSLLKANLNFVGLLPRNIFRLLQANLSFVGAAIINFQRFVASISFFGNLPRNTDHQIPASLNYTGLNKPIGIKNFLAKLILASSLNRNTSFSILELLPFSTRLRDYTIFGLRAKLSSVGTLTKRFEIIHKLTANLEFTGSINKVINLIQMASVSFVGFVTRLVFYRLSGTLNFSTKISKVISNVLRASINFSGSIRRSIEYRITGILTATGALQKYTITRMSSNLSFIGVTTRTTYIQIIASLVSKGLSFRFFVLHQIRSSMSFIGSLTPIYRIIYALKASLNFNGTLLKNVIIRIKSILDLEGFLNLEKTRGIKPVPDVLILKEEFFPTLVLRKTAAGSTLGLISYLDGFPEMEVQSIIKKHKVFRNVQ